MMTDRLARCPTCGSEQRFLIERPCFNAAAKHDPWHDAAVGKADESMQVTGERYTCFSGNNPDSKRPAHRPSEPTDVYQGKQHTGSGTHFVGDDCPREDGMAGDDKRPMGDGRPIGVNTAPSGLSRQPSDPADDLRAALRRLDEMIVAHECRAQCGLHHDMRIAARYVAQKAAEWGLSVRYGGTTLEEYQKALAAILEGRDDG